MYYSLSFIYNTSNHIHVAHIAESVADHDRDEFPLPKQEQFYAYDKTCGDSDSPEPTLESAVDLHQLARESRETKQLQKQRHVQQMQKQESVESGTFKKSATGQKDTTSILDVNLLRRIIVSTNWSTLQKTLLGFKRRSSEEFDKLRDQLITV